MMTLARLIGMDVPAVKLIDPASIQNLPEEAGKLKGRAFAIERFDRPQGGDPVHIEDFAQVFRVYPEAKYQKASYRSIATVLRAETTDLDIAEFVRRLVFSVLIGNADMHLKNWSLIYPNRRKAALSPAYDFVSTIAYLPEGEAALAFSTTKRFDQFSTEELVHLASKAMLPKKLVLDTAKETVARFHEHWPRERRNLPMSAAVAKAIDDHLLEIPIAK
jgi:serine/threonine-protein kinase HipA